MAKIGGLSALYDVEYSRYSNNLMKALEDPVMTLVLSLLINMSAAPKEVQYIAEHDGYFFVTVEKIKSTFFIGEKKQRVIFTELQARGLITVHNFGTPPKRHVRLNENNIIAIYNTVEDKKVVISKAARAIANTKDNYYAALNKAVFAGPEAFKLAMDNMEPRLAEPLYIYSRAMYKYHQVRIEWDSITYGKFKNIIGAKAVDYRKMIDIIKSTEFNAARHLLSFKKIGNVTIDYGPSDNIMRPVNLPEWNEFECSINLEETAPLTMQGDN
jgi:hypothetical protein